MPHKSVDAQNSIQCQTEKRYYTVLKPADVRADTSRVG